MYVVEWTIRAIADLDRLEHFLSIKSPSASSSAVGALLAAANSLAFLPDRGRSAADAGFRELLVTYSNSGYLILYQVRGQTVRIVRVRHQREAGY